MRIRQGNDFIFLWAIERNGLPEDFSNAVNIRLHFKNFDRISEVKSFQIVNGNIVRVEVSPEWASRLGAYRLILSYEFEDQSYSDGDQKCVVDVLAFNIVPKTSEADDVTEMAKTTDIMIGLKGDKGDPFTYDDFTQQQLDAIQQPITDFVAVAEVAENQRNENEDVRIDKESERVQADLSREQRTNTAIQAVTDAQIESEEVISEALNDFNTRVEVVEDAEIIREQNEQDRQTNTATAITNAENAITDVNAAKDDYYDVVKPDIIAQGDYAKAQGDYAKAQGEAIQDDLEQVESDVKEHYVGFGIENRFSKQDILDYPALKLFEYLEFSGLENKTNKNVQNLSLIQIHKSSTTITFIFNINGFNDGSLWHGSIVAVADITLNPDKIEIIKKAWIDYYGDVQVHLIFDYSKYTSSMAFYNVPMSPDKRIFVSDEYVRGVKLDPTTTPGIIHSININRSAILGELPFHKKDYINNEALSYFYDLELTNIKEALVSLSITSLGIVGGKLQLIINENKRVSLATPSIWEQSIVINATIPTEGDEVIFEGQKAIAPLCHFKIKFDYSKWRSTLAFNRQYVADNNSIEILPEYIKELKRIDTPFHQFKSFSNLSSAITEIGGTGYLGGLLYERIALGATENAFRRNFEYKIPKKNTLKIVDYAATVSNIVDITEGGVVRAFNNVNNRITYFDSFEDLKNGVAPKTLYDLPSMNPDFKGTLRFFWQLENGNILARETTVETDIGGLWLIDVSENTATKVFTYRNQWQSTPNHWALEFNEDLIYLSEYGNSPADSGIGTKGDATKLWKSEDYGATWNELYDFKNIPNVIAIGLHIHSVHYDKSWDRLWVTTGDDGGSPNSSRLLLWSDDGGISWDKLDLFLYWGDIGSPLHNAQGLSMYSTPDFLLIGGDDFQNCIYRVAKTHKEDTPVLEIVYRYNPLYNDRITQYTGRWRRLSNGMIVVSLINGDHTPRRTRLLGTYDGLKWYELWSDIEMMETPPQANDGCLTEVDGYLYYQYGGYTPGTENTAVNYIKFKIDTSFI